MKYFQMRAGRAVSATVVQGRKECVVNLNQTPLEKCCVLLEQTSYKNLLYAICFVELFWYVQWILHRWKLYLEMESTFGCTKTLQWNMAMIIQLAAISFSEQRTNVVL